MKISVSIKRTTLPGFTVLQRLGQLWKFVPLWLVSISLQYADGCVYKIKICCYISVKLAQGRYKDLGFISAFVSKMFLHLKSCSMPVSILGCIYTEGLTCSQISEKAFKRCKATYKDFSRLKVWVQCLELCTLWQMVQDSGANSWHSKAYHLAGPEIRYILLLPQEGELWKPNFNEKTAPSVLLPTLLNPVNDKHFQNFSTTIFLSFQEWSRAILINFWSYLNPRSAQARRERTAKWQYFMTP